MHCHYKSSPLCPHSFSEPSFGHFNKDEVLDVMVEEDIGNYTKRACGPLLTFLTLIFCVQPLSLVMDLNHILTGPLSVLYVGYDP